MRILAEGQIQGMGRGAVIVPMDETGEPMSLLPRPEQRRQDVLQCVIDHALQELQKKGIEQEAALQVATSIADHLADTFGGQIISFPKDYCRKLQVRDAQIYAEFTGTNYPELAQRYGLSDRTVRKLIARAQARQKSNDDAHAPSSQQH